MPDAGRVAPISACVSLQHQTLPQNTTIKHYHKTQPLMGATRPASGMKANATNRCVISAICEPFLVYEHGIFPAGRVTPISACVWW